MGLVFIILLVIMVVVVWMIMFCFFVLGFFFKFIFSCLLFDLIIIGCWVILKDGDRLVVWLLRKEEIWFKLVDFEFCRLGNNEFKEEKLGMEFIEFLFSKFWSKMFEGFFVEFWELMRLVKVLVFWFFNMVFRECLVRSW